MGQRVPGGVNWAGNAYVPELPCFAGAGCWISRRHDEAKRGSWFQHGKNPEHCRFFSNEDLSGDTVVLFSVEGGGGHVMQKIIYDWLLKAHAQDIAAGSSDAEE